MKDRITTVGMIVVLITSLLFANPWGGEYNYGPGQNLADIVNMTPTNGVLIIGDGSNFVELAIGAADTFLQSNGATAAWSFIDISDSTNLAVDVDHLKLTDDTLSLSDNEKLVAHSRQGSFLQQIDFTVSESGGTVTGSLEKEGGGDLTQFWSDDYDVLDCTGPVCTVDLTPRVGTDASPAAVFVYILQSDKTTLVANTSFPADSVEHIRVCSLVLQSAATTGTEGALMIRNWNDPAFGITNPRGGDIVSSERVRKEHALHNSGVVLSITGDGTGTITLDTTAGTVYQFNLQAFPALDMAGADNIHIVNQVSNAGSAYETSVNLVADITHFDDGAGGTTLGNNKYFNIVVWGVQNRTGTTSHMMCNIPTGQYNNSLGATTDSQKFSVHTIPSAFRGTGFLIAELTFQFISGPTWTLIQNKDLLGQTPILVPGGGTTTAISMFPDSAFEIFDNGDDSKEGVFQLSGISPGNIRTLTWPDTSSTIITSDATTNFSSSQTFDAGATFNGDVHFDGAAAGQDAEWDKSNNLFVLKDNAIFGFGNGGTFGDVFTEWDGDSFEVSALTANTVINIGDETTGFDIYFKSTIAGDYAWWDWANKTLRFVDSSLQMGDDDRMNFGASNGTWIQLDSDGGPASEQAIAIGTSSGKWIVLEDHVWLKDKLVFTQADLNEFIDSLADGYMDYGATTAHRFNADVVVTGDVGIGTNVPDKSLEIRNASPVIRLRDTGATANATTSFIEFGGTDAGNWVRTGWVGDGSSANTHITLWAEVGDLKLGDSTGDSVLILSGGDATFTGTINIGDSGKINFRDTDISIGSTLTDGILDMSADFAIDMFYDNADVGAEVDGQSFNINRRAVEGDDYISLYVNKDKEGLIGFSGDDDLLQLAADALTVNGTATITGTLTAKTGGITTFTVAASDAPADVIARADYVCSGSADHVEINAAITAAIAVNGVVELSNGIFDIDDSITIQGSNIWLKGSGKGTKIISTSLALGTENIILVGSDSIAYENIVISDMWLEAGVTIGYYGVFIKSLVDYAEVRNCRITAAYGGVLSQGDNTWIHDNFFFQVGDESIQTSNASNIIIENNIILENGQRAEQAAIRIFRSTNVTVANNQIYDSVVTGIGLQGAKQCVITGNIIKNSNTSSAGSVYDIQIVVNITFGTQYTIVSDNVCESSLVTAGIFEGSNANIKHNIISNNMIKDAPISIIHGSIFTEVHGNHTDINVIEYRTGVFKNTSGGSVAKGDVLIAAATGESYDGTQFITTTTQGDDFVLGMALETIADDAVGNVALKGKTASDFKVDGTTDIAIGDFLGTFTTAKIGMKAAAGDMAIAIALEEYTTDGSSGTITVLLITPRKI